MTHQDPSLLMTISHDGSCGRWRVSLRGEVDASAASQLCLVADLLSADGDPVDFDLSGVSFMDRSGWASICAASDTAQRAGVDVRVLNPSRAVTNLTELLMAAHPSRGRQGQVPPLAPVA
jgi:anti-anti-sigma factor